MFPFHPQRKSVLTTPLGQWRLSLVFTQDCTRFPWRNRSGHLVEGTYLRTGSNAASPFHGQCSHSHWVTEEMQHCDMDSQEVVQY